MNEKFRLEYEQILLIEVVLHYRELRQKTREILQELFNLQPQKQNDLPIAIFIFVYFDV